MDHLRWIPFYLSFRYVMNVFCDTMKYEPMIVVVYLILKFETVDFHIQIIEWILLAPKKTAVHNEVLRVLYLHTDPILPLPRLRMISVCGSSLILLIILLALMKLFCILLILSVTFAI